MQVIYKKIDTYLKDEDEAEPWESQAPMLYSGSRQALVDLLRLLPRDQWSRLLNRLKEANIGTKSFVDEGVSGSLRDAERLLGAVQKTPASADPGSPGGALGYLLKELVEVAPKEQKSAAENVSDRIRRVRGFKP